MKKILISGAGGYIGIPLCRILLENRKKVIALDRYFFGRDKMTGIADYDNLEIVVGDIRNVDQSIFEGVGTVIDLAGLSNDASADINIDLTKDINTFGAIRFMKIAKKAGVLKYIYSSSASVYGQSQKMGINEEDILAPQTEYAKSKVIVEKELFKLHDESFQVTALRNATVFGLAERMRLDLAINIMTARAWKERIIYIMGGGKQWRPFIHVKDVVQAFLMVLEGDPEIVAGQAFNVGDDTMNFQIEQLAGFVSDQIQNVIVHIIPDDPDRRTYNLSFNKIKTKLGFQASNNISSSIKEIIRELESGRLIISDPTCYTLTWYKTIMEWEQRIDDLRHNGKILM
jgi:nucleoside-diphosphate-sugar epimerase